MDSEEPLASTDLDDLGSRVRPVGLDGFVKPMSKKLGGKAASLIRKITSSVDFADSRWPAIHLTNLILLNSVA